MKKSIISSLILFLSISLLGYFIYDAKLKMENYFFLNKKIENIILANLQFDLFVKSTLSYENFDIVQNKTATIEKNLTLIYSNKIIQNLKKSELKTSLKNLQNNIDKKLNIIQKVISYKAILNNSFRNIQKLKKFNVNNFGNLYTVIMTIDKNPELNIMQELAKIDKLKYNNKYEKYFLKHATIILKYQAKFNKLNNLLKILQTNKKLEKFHLLYEQYSKSSIFKAQLATIGLFILIWILIIIYLMYSYKLIIINRQLSRFRKTVENSDNIVVITDENETIKYVNEAFTKTTGYTYKEAIGQKPSILKSGKQPDSFYKELEETIHNGKKWSGEFVNIGKSGELSYEKASITPVIEDGKIIEFVAIKLDITNETITQQQLKEKEKLLIQQSKMAAMGEMLENIAHQWRQPLSMISTAATGIITQKALGVSSNEDEVNMLHNINNTVQHLSQTITDFRDFFKSDKTKVLFNIKDAYNKTLNLVNSKFKSSEIEVFEQIIDIQINNLDTELIQVLMNILNNAKDVLETKENQRRLIFVDIYKQNNNAILEFKDNGGGIAPDIIDKIFEPYFTTKHKAQGTGIGLYMSAEMIIKHIGGNLTVKNEEFEYDGITYLGACFTITIPGIIS